MLDWTSRERAEREADGEEITGENELPLEPVTWEDGSDESDGDDEGMDAA